MASMIAVGALGAQYAVERRIAPPILHEVYGIRCRVSSIDFSNHGLTESDIARHTASELLSRAGRMYVACLKSLDEPDRELAERLSNGLIALVEGDDISLVTACPVGGLRLAADSLEADGITVRRLTGAELGRIGSFMDDELITEQPLRGFRADITMERCAIIVRTKSPKLQQPSGNRADAFILALQLLGFEISGAGDAATYTEPGPTLLHGGRKIQLQENATEVRDFSVADLREAIELSDLILKEHFAHPTSGSGSVALHRFASAVCERHAADAVIDFVTALEALLLTDNGELSFRLALFGTRFLEVEASQRQKVFNELRQLYAVRSKLVHGDKKQWNDPAELPATRTLARSYCARMLVKALREGWPTSDSLRALALA